MFYGLIMKIVALVTKEFVKSLFLLHFYNLLIKLCIASNLFQRFYVATSRQLKRLQSKTRSPIYSHFSETISGATVIRAYCAEKSFIKTSNDRINLNQRFQYAIISANR